MAEAAVQRLFESESPSSRDSLLVAGCRDSVLLQAIARYTVKEDETGLHDPPTITVLTSMDSISSMEVPAGLDVDIVTDDFLREGAPVSTAFDYVLSDPPQLDWEQFDEERRREYATQFVSLTTADGTVSGEALYIEQTLRHLSTGGIAIVLTTPELWDESGPGNLHSEVHEKLQRIESVSMADSTRALAIFRGGLLSATPAPPPTPDAATIEANLDVSLDPGETGLTADSIASAPVEQYPGTLDATSGYTRMLLDDYDAVLVGGEDGSDIGYISRTRFQAGGDRTLADTAIEIDENVIIDPEASIGRVIEILGRERFRFVAGDDSTDIEGVVTRFDLNRLPVYLFLFDRFSEFEIGLRHLIREVAPDWNEQASVTVPWRGSRTIVPDRLACAQLGELIRIVDELGLRSEIPLELPTEDGTTLRDLKQLRNSVAHYSPLVHTMGEARRRGERDAMTLAAEYELLVRYIEA